MLDWVNTAAVLFIGFIVMAAGLIQWLFIGFMTYLLILVVLGVLGRIWLGFQEPNNK